MKKNKKTIKSKKSEKLNNSMVNKKPANKIEAKKKNSEKLKKEKKERKEKNITNVQQSIDALSKALLSMTIFTKFILPGDPQNNDNSTL